MSTISRGIAERMIANDGLYDAGDESPGNQRAWAIFRYHNQKFGTMSWAVIYNPAQYVSYLRSPAVGKIEILW